MSTAYSRRQLYPHYKAYIAGQRCIVCECYGVEVAHVGDRGFGRKCSDLETLPICTRHHQTGRDSAHVLGKRFYEHHGLDKQSLIEQYQAEYRRQYGDPEKYTSKAPLEPLYEWDYSDCPF